MREHNREFAAANVNLAAIGLADIDHAREFREECGIAFPLLVDDERVVYHALELRRASVLHLLRPDNFRARKQARREGHRNQRLGAHVFQLGGSLVIAPGKDRDAGGVIRYQHVSRTFGDNADVATLLRIASSVRDDESG